jgi:hypothetical protein
MNDLFNSKTGLVSSVFGVWNYVIISCIFDSPRIQILATVTILTYGVKTIEQQHRIMRKLRITEIQWA